MYDIRTLIVQGYEFWGWEGTLLLFLPLFLWWLIGYIWLWRH